MIHFKTWEHWNLDLLTDDKDLQIYGLCIRFDPYQYSAIIFEYNHFSEDTGKPLGEVIIIDVIIQSL